jgi:hypothetical protein
VVLNASLLVFALVSFELLLCSLAPTSFSHRGAGGIDAVPNYLDIFWSHDRFVSCLRIFLYSDMTVFASHHQALHFSGLPIYPAEQRSLLI